MTRDLNYWIRIGSPLVATLVVFLIIQSIISQGSSIDNKSDNPNFVDFIRIKQDDSFSTYYSKKDFEKLGDRKYFTRDTLEET